MTQGPIPKQIFLSYAREDEAKVRELYRKLSDLGLNPWMDQIDMLPGEKWGYTIQEAIRRSTCFVACLSGTSLNKRGFLQKEIRVALKTWQEKLESDIYLIPVRLENCDVPEGLSKFHWVDLFEEDGFAKLVKGIEEGLRRQAKDASSSTLSDSQVVRRRPSHPKQGESQAETQSQPQNSPPFIPVPVGRPESHSDQGLVYSDARITPITYEIAVRGKNIEDFLAEVQRLSKRKPAQCEERGSIHIVRVYCTRPVDKQWFGGLARELGLRIIRIKQSPRMAPPPGPPPRGGP